MKIIQRLFLAAVLCLGLSSCQLIGAALQTAWNLAPLLLLADEKSRDKNGPDALRQRARQIQEGPAYDGRMDWIKQEKSTEQEVAAR